jgi:hypothetical protein
MKIIIWILICYGLMNIIVFSQLFEPLRNYINKLGYKWKIFNLLYELITCPMCISVWIGFIFGLVLYSPSHLFLDINTYYSWFLDGLLASGSVWIINTIVEFLEENRINKM